MPVLTQRLYQRDSFLTHFKAAVLDARAEHGPAAEGSARLGILLDRTAFYPTGGGQPHDTGSLAGLPVIEVRESDDGPIHVLELRDGQGNARPVHLTVGEEVEGVVDWPRRFDHMQQHSGQHILSKAFVEVASARTRSFHLGDLFCTIDVDLHEPDEETVARAAARANEIIWGDRAVTVREEPAGSALAESADASALAGLSLKPGDPVRIIDIGGFDETPCGGTHVARAGQVGLVGITAFERFKGMCRVTFVCGGRAARWFHEANRAVAESVSRLSARPHEIPNAIDRLLLDREELLRRVRELTSRMIALEVEKWAAEAATAGPYRFLRKVFRSRDRGLEEAQILARKFVEAPGRLALVAVVEGSTATLLVARSEPGAEAGRRALPGMGEAIADVCRRVGGRGGGSASSARAGGIPESRLEEAMDLLLARVAADPDPGRS